MPNVVQDSMRAECHSTGRRSKPTERDRKKHLQQRFELLAVIGLATMYLVWFAWPLIWSASENARLVGAFSTDEEAHVMLLKEAIDNRIPRLGYIQYGYAYLNMGLLPLLLLSFFTDVTEQQIIVWLRMIPTLFAIATVALTFVMARRFFGRLAAWLSAFLLSFGVLTFLRMSSLSHSDIPQLFFLVLAIYFCCRSAVELRPSWLLWACAAAGLAFGCKYSGLFLLPIIGYIGALIALQLEPTQSRVRSHQVVKAFRLLAVAVGVALLLAALVAVPYAAAAYVGEEYYGVSIPQFLGTLRLIFIVLGAGIVLLAAAPFVWAPVRQRPRLVFLMKQGMLWAAIFSAAFVLTSPFNVFSVRSGFVRGFLSESLHSSFGHLFAAESGRLIWLRILSSPGLLDRFILGMAAVGLALTAHKVAKRGLQGLLLPESVMWVWSLFYLIFLLWRVNVRTHRALLPIIPILLILAAHAASQVLRYVESRLPRRIAPLLTAAGLLLIVGLELPESLHRALEFRQLTSRREQGSAVLLAGQWLEAHYPRAARILYDPPSYVPPVFADAHATPWGGTVQMLGALQPDVVIVNELSSDQFSDTRRAATYARDEALFIAKHEYYETLRDGTAGYELVRDFGTIQVYERQRDGRLPLSSTGLTSTFRREARETA